ncbi:hypothetical protein [Nonomuraea sp. NPDC050310]|uniref:hypothetical protein n=1 Tax=Nonomuraea sp. NPDC050310 TaxID=3154935 RepID=UPI003408C794
MATAALAGFPCLYPPVWLPATAQYFARFAVGGVQVEFSTVEVETGSDSMECVGRGPWEHCVLVPCGPFQVPVVRLELRLATELVRDRADRYQPLVDHFATHGFDTGLLERALVAQGLHG